MCGIYGEVSLSRECEVGEFGETATDRLQHRGPDERATWQEDGVFLGVRRLSIIDLRTGAQPIWNEDGTCCIVYNGELYNFRELRQELGNAGHAFRTRSDTEVVLHAYEEWGPECLERFNGMFALAVWDRSARTLFLARDRVGEKPLYLYRDGDRLRFASEIKALLADPEIPRRIDPRGLANFLAFGHAVAPETMYEGVQKLLPGHCLTAREGRVQIRSYWDVAPDESSASELEFAQGIRALCSDSVRRRMLADVPVGAFLSGGVDSSAVAALMMRSTSAPVKTFALGFREGRAYDELPDARKVADHLGSEHHELVVDSEALVHALRTLVYHFDDPFADPASLPLYLLSRFASEHVKVVLAGDGGDELFGGYRRYAADQLAPLYQRLPEGLTRRWIPSIAQRVPRLRRTKRAVAALPIADPARRYASWLTVFTGDMQAELLRPEVLASVLDYDPAEVYERRYAELAGHVDHLNRLMYVDLKTWLPDDYLEKTDKATMACGLEARLPLLDHRLVELAFAIPARFKVRGWALKRIFKQAVAPLVPAETLQKPKHGFAVPVDEWFRGDLRTFAWDVLTDPSARTRGLFEPTVVRRLLHDHAQGRVARADCLWTLVNFELWHRTHLDGQPV